ncbi:MAG: hypothetical protein ABIO60_03165, partial [Aquaticitalea sp.]
PAQDINDNVTICKGSSYLWPYNGRYYVAANSPVVVNVDNGHGCYYKVTLTIDEYPVTPDIHDEVTICKGESYTWPFNGMTYTAADSPVAIHPRDDNGCLYCVFLTIHESDLPVVSIGQIKPACLESGIIPLTGGIPSGGVYSGTGVVANEGGTYSFNPSLVGAGGSSTITYTYTDSNGCSGSAMTNLSVINCEQRCDTVFAYNGDLSTCFLDIPEIRNNRWGWSNHITEPGTYEFILYGGAAHCDISKGYNYGTATVVYSTEGTVTVTYNMTGGSVLNEAHVYIGCTPAPIVKRGKRNETTVAPGQYNFNPNLGGGVSSYQVGPVAVSGDSFYIIIHGAACSSGAIVGDNGGSSFAGESVNCNADVIVATDVKGHKGKGILRLSPNPFTTHLNLAYQYDYNTDVDITIVDIHGIVYGTYKNNKYIKNSTVDVKFDLSRALDRLLFVKIVTNEGIEMKKIISSNSKN